MEQNDSYKLYAHYLKSAEVVDGTRRLSDSFLAYARKFRLAGDMVKPRKLRDGQMIGVGVRFSFELLDISIGQYAIMFLPHTSPRDLCPREEVPLEYTRCFVGALHYLSALRCGTTREEVLAEDGTVVLRAAFPSQRLLPAHSEAGSLLFPQDWDHKSGVHSTRGPTPLSKCRGRNLT